MGKASHFSRTLAPVRARLWQPTTGAFGDHFSARLQVDHSWVDKALRGQGYSSRLLSLAKHAARAHVPIPECHCTGLRSSPSSIGCASAGTGCRRSTMVRSQVQ
jgi:GNAT superfamily N-acetyltransferase